MFSVFTLCQRLIELDKKEGLQNKIDVYFANNRLNIEEYNELVLLLKER